MTFMFSEELIKIIYHLSARPNDFNLFNYLAMGKPTSKVERQLCEIVEELAGIDIEDYEQYRAPY